MSSDFKKSRLIRVKKLLKSYYLWNKMSYFKHYKTEFGFVCFICSSNHRAKSIIFDVYINQRKIIYDAHKADPINWDYRGILCSTSCQNIFKSIPQFDVFSLE